MAASEAPKAAGIRFSDLVPRALVGALLVALAVVADWVGGWTFNIIIAGAVLVVFAEWAAMHRLGAGVTVVGGIVVAGAALLAGLGLADAALALAVGGAALLLTASRQLATGIVYASLPAIALIWLRQQDAGKELVIWTLAIVWATDIFAYFAGRAIGGPKIAPRISPSKTWAGLGGGMLGAGVVAAILASVFDLGFAPALAGLIGGLLAVAAQIGDFYESHLKRRAGVKDSGRLLPGHGGVMDRLDGVVPVAVLVALAVWLLP